MPDPGQAQVIRCMFGTNAGTTAEGGLATVHWLTDVPAEQTVVSAETMLAGQRTQSFASVFVAGDADGYVAESFSPQGTHIQFCGHGALAAAWVVFDQLEPKAATLTFSSELQNWQARPSSDDSSDEGSDITLIYKRPLPTDCAVPGFAVTALGVQPLCAATVGGASGYLLLELPDADAVRALQPDYGAISAATDRALIITAQTMYNREPACVFRYFAPQYGTPEDDATGSAAVQLAAFWSPRLGCKRFTAMQLSPQGAMLQLGCAGDEVDLKAQVGYR